MGRRALRCPFPTLGRGNVLRTFMYEMLPLCPALEGAVRTGRVRLTCSHLRWLAELGDPGGAGSLVEGEGTEVVVPCRQGPT